MENWIFPALLAAVLWGIVGLLQKMASNRLDAGSLLVWVTAGYVAFLPYFFWTTGLGGLRPRDLLLGILAGSVNGLGTWFLFASLGQGAKACVAIPLTALYPLFTVMLAYIFLNERLTPAEWIGIALALLGAAMLSYENGQPGGEKPTPISELATDEGKPESTYDYPKHP
jgi:transporter family protein